MNSKQCLILLCFAFAACSSGQTSKTTSQQLQLTDSTSASINWFKTIASIPTPAGYKRLNHDTGSFAFYLQNIPLKKDKTVYLFNGKQKDNQSAQFAVLDISTGDKNLQQCADAVMRLRAEYLFSIHQYEKIIFYDNDGTAYRFTSPYTKTHLLAYLQQVFGMCGTASLSKQLIKTNLIDIKPGDVFIRGGFPGHAVTVMDVAVNKQGQKAYIIAQSYMPAQDIHILLNPLKESTAWYFVDDEDEILTPEYLFSKDELKKW